MKDLYVLQKDEEILGVFESLIDAKAFQEKYSSLLELSITKTQLGWPDAPDIRFYAFAAHTSSGSEAVVIQDVEIYKTGENFEYCWFSGLKDNALTSHPLKNCTFTGTVEIPKGCTDAKPYKEQALALAKAAYDRGYPLLDKDRHTYVPTIYILNRFANSDQRVFYNDIEGQIVSDTEISQFIWYSNNNTLKFVLSVTTPARVEHDSINLTNIHGEFVIKLNRDAN